LQVGFKYGINYRVFIGIEIILKEIEAGSEEVSSGFIDRNTVHEPDILGIHKGCPHEVIKEPYLQLFISNDLVVPRHVPFLLSEPFGKSGITPYG